MTGPVATRQLALCRLRPGPALNTTSSDDPCVIGGLALGNLRRREIVLEAMAELSHAGVAADADDITA